jgi:hypothetical protein
MGLDYNVFFPIGSNRNGIYVSMGYYYRWLKQRWNTNWSAPFNFSTDDQEGYAQGELGFQKSIGNAGSYWTLDLNYRDNYSYYHFDNVAFEGTFNAAFSQNFIIRMSVGIRTAALFMGTGSISENFAGLGFVFY